MFGLIIPVLFAAAPGPLPADTIQAVEASVQKTIEAKQAPGVVVLVLSQDQIIYRKAFGKLTYDADAKPMLVDTIFDLASLTKPIATGTSIHQLIEQGKLQLSDPVVKHWPEFKDNGKESITIEQLLLHTSGLLADNAVGDYTDGHDKAMAKIAALKLSNPVGSKFTYSDVGFIVLGDLVRKLSGESVDQYVAKHVFEPLGMKDTGYTPNAERKARSAPTAKRADAWIIGDVHDPRAYHLKGVAGHAGLFGTADDLAKYARMLLHQGELDGKRILSVESVKRFTEPVKVPGNFQRSRGWDIQTSYSAPAGTGFPLGEGFGHTGFTGTSIWIHPPTQSALIILSNRVHPDEKGNVTPMRRELGTLVGNALRLKK
jgi:serine-type D-Ala-D-Ala carboxypeptidase